jgi:tetratricopeptide (TPR) repeat protein
VKRTLLFVLLVVVVCTPLLLVAIFVTAAYVPALDKLTLSMSPDIRTAVADAAMQKAGHGTPAIPGLERVLRLDPDNAAALTRLCSARTAARLSLPERAAAIPLCRKAVARARSSENFYNLGTAQEASGDPCAAQTSYNAANSAESGEVDNLRAMGRTSLACSDVTGSVAEFEVARDLDAKSIADPGQDVDDRDDEADDLQLDQQWLVIAYTAANKPKLAAQACSAAYPMWKSCSCTLQAGKPSCKESPPVQPR